jgi:hypothetical protein
MPVLSSQRKKREEPNESEMVQMREDVRRDLSVLTELTGFEISNWL